MAHHQELVPSLSRDELIVLQPPVPSTLERLDHVVRMTFVEISPVTGAHPHPRAILEDSVRFLEQRRAIAGIAEALHRSAVRTFKELEERRDEVVLLARRLTRIDPVEILVRDAAFVSSAKDAGQALRVELPEDFLRQIVRGIESLLASCPIEALVDLGEHTGNADLGHRGRLSYDWLAAFVRRHTTAVEPTQDTVGQIYAEGRVTVEEASLLLGMPIPDAVAWLEHHGYARDIALIHLDEKDRARRLAAIRQDRREPKEALDPELAARDVIATQRIEDVDARPWIAEF